MSRSWWVLAPLAALVVWEVLGGVAGAELRREPRLSVVTPRDGASVRGPFLLVWHAVPGIHRYALAVDATLPAAGRVVRPNDTTLLAQDVTAMRLTLGSRVGGSPSLRNWHEIVIAPLDEQGRRIGERTAVVHVRSSGATS